MVSPMIAAKAYAATQGTTGLGAAAGAKAVPEGPDFAQMVQTAITQTTNASRAAEAQMAAHVQGKAELVDVVTAVASAQSSLETVMAVRDQVISAYQEIMRMPI